MALSGELVASMTGRKLSGLRTQVHQSMVALLLHLKDSCRAVVTASASRWAFALAGGAGDPRVAGGWGLGVCRWQGVLPGAAGLAPFLVSLPLPMCTHVHSHTCTHTHVQTRGRAVCGQDTVCPAHCYVPSAWPVVGAQVAR